MLLEIDRTNGQMKAGYNLHTTPIFDGIASAHGRMLVSMSDGSLLCLGGTGTNIDAIPAETIAAYNADSKVVPPSKRRNKAVNRKQRVFNLKLKDAVEAAQAPYVINRNVKITAKVIPTAPNGVILAHGGNVQGYAVYLKDNKLTFTSRIDSKLTTISDPNDFPTSGAMIGAHLDPTGKLTLAINGDEVATKQGKPIKNHPADGLQVGEDSGSQVGEYGNGEFNGTVSDLVLSLRK